ncbi:hypothetical protein ACPV5T_00645 [Vibrio astriarenae]
MQHSLSKQSGHAAILFAMMIPAFFGLFTLGSDGARMMQSKARLGDAMEAASLAVTAHASTDNSANGINQTIANNYIEYYAADLKEVNSVSVTRRDCDTATECVPGEDMKFFQYDVTASVKFDSWFPGNEAIVGFGKNFDVGAAGRARKYQSHAIDVVLAADFSGSMRNNWNGSVRYLGLIDVVNSVADELAHFNDIFDSQVGVNTIGIAPYDHYNRVIVGVDNEAMPFDETMHCDQKKVKGSYNAGNETDLSKKLRIPGTDNNSDKEADEFDEDRIVLGRVDNLVYTNTTLQYEKTIEQMKSGGVDSQTEYCNPDKTELARFYDIPLTSNFESFKSQLSTFRPDHASGRGYTASFQGFLGATRLLKKGSNSRKLLILLSDGEDTGSYSSIGNGSNTPTTGFKQIASNLTNTYGMCDEIRSYLSTYTDSDGTEQEAQVELAVIGFTYNPSNHPALETCVGEENVFKAENKEEILAQILSLIAEEIGRLK